MYAVDQRDSHGFLLGFRFLKLESIPPSRQSSYLIRRTQWIRLDAAATPLALFLFWHRGWKLTIVERLSRDAMDQRKRTEQAQW